MWGWVCAGIAYLCLRPASRAETKRREAWREEFERRSRDFDLAFRDAEQRARAARFQAGHDEAQARERAWERQTAMRK